MKINVTYHRRRFKDEEQSVDFYTRTFSSSSDDVFVIRIPKKSPNQYIHSTRKYKLLSELSDWKVGPASFHSRGHSSRVCDRTSVLRGPLSDRIFDHYFRNIWKNSAEEKRNQCTYLNCLWFYMYTKEHNRERVLTWIKKENIFLKKYVFVPIVLWSHRCLLIFCHLGGSINSETKAPCMLLLDSLHAMGPLRLEPLIRRFVSDIYDTEDRVEDKYLIQEIPLLVPKVPQQRNGHECGVFVLYYANLFLESAPENFSVTKAEDYPYFMKEDWFTEEELEEFYVKLESVGTESSDSEESVSSECSSNSDDICRIFRI